MFLQTKNTRVVGIHNALRAMNVITKGAGKKQSKGEILRSTQNDSEQEIQKDESKALSGEMCQEHGVPESECSLCNPDMKIKSLAPDIERGYEELLKNNVNTMSPLSNVTDAAMRLGSSRSISRY